MAAPFDSTVCDKEQCDKKDSLTFNSIGENFTTYQGSSEESAFDPPKLHSNVSTTVYELVNDFLKDFDVTAYSMKLHFPFFNFACIVCALFYTKRKTKISRSKRGRQKVSVKPCKVSI